MAVLIDSTADLIYGGAVFETAGGTKVAIICQGTSVEAYKSIDGTPSQIGSTQGPATIFGTSTSDIIGVHAAIDSNDLVHVVAANDVNSDTRDVAYATITDPDGGSPSWSSWEAVATYDQPPPFSHGRVSISIDSNDKPHVCYLDITKFMGTNYNQVYYTEKTGASWSTPVEVSNISDAHWQLAPSSFSLKASNNGEICMFASQDLHVNTLTSGSWGTASSLNITATIVDWSNSGGMILDTSAVVRELAQDFGSPYELYVDDTDTGARGYAQSGNRHMASIGADGDDLYVFYIDTGRDVHLYSNTGSGWTDEGDLNAGTGLDGILVGWSWNNLNNTTSIDYIYYDNFAGVWWDEWTLSSGITITVDQLTLAGSALSATIVPGAVSVVMDPLDLVSAINDITVVAVVSVVMDQLTLAGAAIALTVVPGAVSPVMDSLTLAGAAISITVDAPIEERVPQYLIPVQPNGSQRLAALHRS